MNRKLRKLTFTAFTVVLLTLVAVFGASALNVGNVTNLRSGKTATAITLAWGKAQNAVGYRIFEWTGGNWKAIETTAHTSVKITSLKPGTKHTYAVRAYGKQNGKTMWAGSYQTLTTATRPVTTAKIATSSYTNYVKLAWSKVSGASGYRVYKYNPVTKTWDTAVKATSANSAVVKGLVSGTKYYFAVKPYVNTGSEIVWASTYTKVLTATQPVAPVKLTANAAKTAVTLTWTKSAGATGYRVFRYNSATKAWVAVVTTAKLNYTVNSLKANTAYIFAVRPYINTGTQIIWASAFTKVTVKTLPASINLTMGTGGVAGTYYGYGSVLGSYIKQFTGINVNVVSTAGSAANLVAIDDGQFQLATVQSDIASYAWNGTHYYDFEGGIKSFRAVCSLYPETVQIITTDPWVESVSDLEGMTVAIGAAGSGVYFTALDVLSASGLSEDDINPVYCSFADAADALKDGRVEAAFIVAGVPTFSVSELLNCYDDIYLVPIEENTVKRLIASKPYYVPCVIEEGCYDGLYYDVTTVCVNSLLVVSEDVSDDVVYSLTKAIFDNTDEITMAHAKGEYLSLNTATKGVAVPFHPGAARYFAEKGIYAETK